MGYEGLELIAKMWIGAFNEHDIDELLALYHTDARHYSPQVEAERSNSDGWLRGKEQLREWWQGKFDEMPGLE